MMLKKKIGLSFFMALCTLFFITNSANADTKKDIVTLSKAISFIKGGPTGTVNFEIVHDAGNSASAAHANEVAGIASSPVGSGKVKLQGKKVSVGSVGSTGAKVVFVTRGLESKYSSILSKAASKGAITVSTDENCIVKGGCVLVVKTQPSVDIMASAAASAKTGTEFSSAFSMMISQKP